MKIDKLIRSKRKTLSIEIGDQGEIIVRAPMRASDRWISGRVKENQAWIIKHQNLERHKASQAPAKQFVSGESFLFLGDWYDLQLTSLLSKKLEFDYQFRLNVNLQHRARDLFVKWYKEQAKEIIPTRTSKYADILDLEFKKVGITSAMRQWGSCSGRNNINFSWRLIMAPVEVIDYVIVHELIHIEEKNHSPRFWKGVEQILPEYKQHKSWLNKNNHFLRI